MRIIIRVIVFVVLFIIFHWNAITNSIDLADNGIFTDGKVLYYAPYKALLSRASKELDKEIFIAYWNFLHICENAVWIDIKAKPGIPSHIYEKLSDELKGNMPKLGLNR